MHWWNALTGKMMYALVECSDGEDDVCGYNEKGKVLIEDGAEYKDDLMMLPEKHEGWINIYKTYDDKFAAMTGSLYLYKTEKEAKMEADPDKVLSTVKIEWEE